MKMCSYCGRENDDSATHCLGCGTERFQPTESGDLASKAEAELSMPFVPRQLTEADKQQAFVVLKTCRTLAEADWLASQLESAGLQPFIPDRALMEVFTCNVRIEIPTAQYDAAAQFLAWPAPEEPESDFAHARAQLPLDLPVKCLLLMLPGLCPPGLVVGAWLRARYSKQGYTKRADSIWIWLSAGIVGWLLIYAAVWLSKYG